MDGLETATFNRPSLAIHPSHPLPDGTRELLVYFYSRIRSLHEQHCRTIAGREALQ